MSFLQPGFLWGLLALAIPVIIHLFSFRRVRRVEFSNTQWLRQVENETATRDRLRHLLILASRLLAVLFLVLAFARPFIPEGNADQADVRTLALYIDDSPSMLLEAGGVSNFDRARSAALDLIDAAPSGTEFLLVTGGLDPRHARPVDAETARRFLDELAVATVRLDLDDVRARVRALTYGAVPLSTHLYYLTDLQAVNGLPAADTTLVQRILPLTPDRTANLVIDSAWFDAPVLLAGTANRLNVRLRNTDPDRAAEGRLVVQSGDAVRSVTDFDVPAAGRTVDTLSLTLDDAGWNVFELRIGDHPITFDDTYVFRVFAERSIRVLSITGDASTGRSVRAVFDGLDAVDWTTRPVRSVEYGDLPDQHLVVLDGLNTIPAGLATTLSEGLEQGAYHVVLLPGASPDLASYNRFLSGCGAPVLESVVTTPRRVLDVHADHPVLRGVLDAVDARMDLPRPSTWLSFRPDAASRPVLSYASAPAVFSHPVGNGMLNIFTAPASPEGEGFEDNALFAPMLYRMATLGVQAPGLQATIRPRTEIDLMFDPPRIEGGYVLTGPDGVDRIPVVMRDLGGARAVLPGDGLPAGAHRLWSTEVDHEEWVALNVDRAESDPAVIGGDELAAAIDARGLERLDASGDGVVRAAALGQAGRPLWTLCIVLCLLFLAAETLIVRLVPRTA